MLNVEDLADARADEEAIYAAFRGAENWYRPVSMRGLRSLFSRCPNFPDIDMDDMHTWGDVNWLSYRVIDGRLYVIDGSYEGLNHA